jgi:hypothetical protein
VDLLGLDLQLLLLRGEVLLQGLLLLLLLLELLSDPKLFPPLLIELALGLQELLLLLHGLLHGL